MSTKKATLKQNIEHRLFKMNHPVITLSRAQLAQKFGRTSSLDDEHHYQVQLAGCPLAYSIWNTARDLTDDPQYKTLNAEIGTLAGEGRIVVSQLAVLIGLGGFNYYLQAELLAAPDLGVSIHRPAMLQRAMGRFLNQFWTLGLTAPQTQWRQADGA